MDYPPNLVALKSNSMCVYRGGVKKFPLQLNVTKIEAVWFGTWRNLDRLHDHDRHVEINLEIISPVAVIHDLGVYLDELFTKQHVNRIAATCFFHLRRLRQIRRRIRRDLTVRLILAFITTRLDYCNSVLSRLATDNTGTTAVRPKRGSMARIRAPCL